LRHLGDAGAPARFARERNRVAGREQGDAAPVHGDGELGPPRHGLAAGRAREGAENRAE